MNIKITTCTVQSQVDHSLSSDLPTASETHDVTRVVLLLDSLKLGVVVTEDLLRRPSVGGSIVAIDRDSADGLAVRARDTSKALRDLGGSLRDELVVCGVVPLEGDGDRNEGERAVGRVRRRARGSLLEDRGKEGFYSDRDANGGRARELLSPCLHANGEQHIGYG